MLGHQKPRDHAGIAAVEIAEIMVRRQFAAIDRPGVAHHLFGIGMAGARHHRPPTCIGHQSLCVQHDTGVMDHCRPGFLVQECLAQQPHDIFARHEPAQMVEQETAVEIAIPSHPEISFRFPHSPCRGGPVFRQHGVGHTLGKAGIGRMVDAGEAQVCPPRRQIRRDGIKRRPRRAVARVDQNMQGSQALRLHKPGDLRHISTAGVAPVMAGACHSDRQHHPALCPRPDRGKLRRRQRCRPLPHQLQPVVIGGIV